MGQKFSVDIQLENGNDAPTVAGTSLRGKVIFRVKRRVKPAALTLHLLGREQTCLNPRIGKPSAYQAKTIARAVTKLRDCSRGSHIKRGEHVMPFDFLLPASLPATCQFSKGIGHGVNGLIVYSLRVEFGDDFRLEQEFQVLSAPLPSDVVPCIAEPKTHELKSLGLLARGYLSVGASVENTRVGKGEALRIAVASRNDTSVNLNRVCVKLVEQIQYRSGSKEDTIKLELGKLKDIDLPGLERTKAPKAEVRRSIRQGFQERIATTYERIYQDLVSGDNRFEVVIPTSARDSYDGNIITISHYVKITFITRALAENPTIKIPIVIGNSKEEQPTVPQREPNQPLSTVIADDDVSDTETTVSVGSRAEYVPMASAIPLGPFHGRDMPEQSPISARSPYMVSSDNVHVLDGKAYNSYLSVLNRPIPIPTAPTESMLYDDDDDDSIESDDAHISPFRQSRQDQSIFQQQDTSSSVCTGYSLYQMYDRSAQPALERRLSYSYDTESGITGFSDGASRLGAPVQRDQQRQEEFLWLLEGLLQELNGSIQDYEVVVSKIREPGYKELFSNLTPVEFRSIIGHVRMSHQVQVALFLAKQMALTSSFTCEHCAAALQKTSDYFRSNMVETLLPFCNDIDANSDVIKSELNAWEIVITSRFFEDVA